MEIWKPVALPGYEHLYQVSNKGRVRRDGRILRPFLTDGGYLMITLKSQKRRKSLVETKKRIAKNIVVHRLVAFSFCKKPKGADTVNHKNFNKIDNTSENLEWCSQLYNTQHAVAGGRFKEPPNKRVPDEKILSLAIEGAPITIIAEICGLAPWAITTRIRKFRRDESVSKKIPYPKRGRPEQHIIDLWQKRLRVLAGKTGSKY